jgi:hypothetical protein
MTKSNSAAQFTDAVETGGQQLGQGDRAASQQQQQFHDIPKSGVIDLSTYDAVRAKAQKGCAQSQRMIGYMQQRMQSCDL